MADVSLNQQIIEGGNVNELLRLANFEATGSLIEQRHKVLLSASNAAVTLPALPHAKVALTLYEEDPTTKLPTFNGNLTVRLNGVALDLKLPLTISQIPTSMTATNTDAVNNRYIVFKGVQDTNT
jgi:hypothetical protein